MIDSDNGRLPAPAPLPPSPNPPRILIVGAGSRGNAYARAIRDSSNGVLVSIAEPIEHKRRRFGEQYIWGGSGPSEGQEFEDWRQFLAWEKKRRLSDTSQKQLTESIDAIFICVMDEMHMEAIVDLVSLDLHIMCEKPLAVSLAQCLTIYKSLLPNLPDKTPSKLFSIGHVLRYSPHNMLLRKLLLEERIIGDILSINHTEPIGWWHFAHSYVRGNWRKEMISAPTLLTKSCHDIDLILWIMSYPSPANFCSVHFPSTVSSVGALQYFKKSRKPREAGSATNCLSCPIEMTCKYSAKKIYLGPELKGLATGNLAWPVCIVLTDIEDHIMQNGYIAGEAALKTKLSEDYPSTSSSAEVASRNWFGRCVYECDNDVCDNQIVTMTWDESPLPPLLESGIENPFRNRGAKTAIFHMVAHTTKICERYSHFYGSNGEIYADSDTITVEDFRTGTKKTYKPARVGGGHGGGDDGLARQFILAVDQVKNHGVSVLEAQKTHIGCTLEEIIMSHAMVFAAEEARRSQKVVKFPEWWYDNIISKLSSNIPET
ncbi:hypothetical protein EPUL_000445, partial [Erysiphe pulchra]